MSGLVFPLEGPYRWTVGWGQPRPLALVRQIRELEAAGRQAEAAGLKGQLHPHAAADWRQLRGSRFRAPEDGEVVRVAVFRHGGPVLDLRYRGRWCAFSNYDFAVYGGLVVLYGASGLTHVFAHVEPAAMVGAEVAWAGGPQGAYSVTLHTLGRPATVRAGERLGTIGAAGQIEPGLPSLDGVHLHYEVHMGLAWTPYGQRRDPAQLYPEEWAKHAAEAA